MCKNKGLKIVTGITDVMKVSHHPKLNRCDILYCEHTVITSAVKCLNELSSDMSIQSVG